VDHVGGRDLSRGTRVVIAATREIDVAGVRAHPPLAAPAATADEFSFSSRAPSMRASNLD
jgi:2-oxo-4-hydroxy-4-carboxy--5-ureidoimidazoline (OHCU) decarboxylase